MDRRTFLKQTSMAAAVFTLPGCMQTTGKPKAAKPYTNFVIIFTDDQGYGDVGANPRDEYYMYYGDQLQAVRQGKWKLHLPHGYRSYENVEPGKDGLPGPYGHGETTLELYDLKGDIGERNNVAEKHPEIVERLKALADKARVDLGDSLTNTKGPNVRPVDRVSE
jgi:arylsulfatase A-like enzyme